jgi:hypothetical protein
MCGLVQVTTSARIRRLGEQVSRGATLLAWYYRTRPEALRFLAAPAVATFVVLVLTVAWGLPAMTLLALVVVGTFAVFALPFIDEIRSLEKATDDLRAGPVPWLEEVGAKERPPAEAQALPADAPPDATTIAATAAPSAPIYPPVSSNSAYELHELTPAGRIVLRTSTDFFEISDTAFELIDTRDPAGLEIIRLTGSGRETVWRYDRSNSTAEREEPTLTDIFGFDPSRWVGPPTTRPPHNR